MSAPQPSQESIIQALIEENQNLIENKRYLIAIIKDLQLELGKAQTEQPDEPDSERQEEPSDATIVPVKAASRRRRTT